MRHIIRTRSLLYGAAIALSLVVVAHTPAAGQDEDPTVALRQAIENAPERPPGIDTALVFTNLGRTPAKLAVQAYNHNGRPLGSKELEVPGNGLAYLFASELDDSSPNRRLIGKVVARARGKLTGTAVLVGGPVTDLPAIVKVRRLTTSTDSLSATDVATHYVTRVTFPVVAAF